MVNVKCKQTKWELFTLIAWILVVRDVNDNVHGYDLQLTAATCQNLFLNYKPKNKQNIISFDQRK